MAETIEGTRTCSVPGCGQPHHARGFCAGHVGKDQRLRRASGGRQTLNPDGTPLACCQVAGCWRPEQAGGYCAAHFQRRRRGGDVRADRPVRTLHPQAVPRPCAVAGCRATIVPGAPGPRGGTRNRGARGMCLKHYRAWLKGRRAEKGPDHGRSRDDRDAAGPPGGARVADAGDAAA